MDHLPPELIDLIVDHLYDDNVALKACSLVSRAFLPSARVHLFENIELRFRHSVKDRNIDPMRKFISTDSRGLLSHTRKLSIPYPGLIAPFHLEEIFDHLMAFNNVRELKLDLDAFHFVNHDFMLASRYFFHFQPVLRSLHLTTSARNPKDLIVFIAFFPFLEEVSLSFCDPSPEPVLGSWVKELDPNLLTPLQGMLRIPTIPLDSQFIVELAKVRVLYHTLELGGRCMSPGKGVPELVAACAPTLRVLRFPHSCELLSFPVMDRKLNFKFTVAYNMDLDPRLTLATCTQLAEIQLPACVEHSQGGIGLHAALLSTISSPHFRKIELVFGPTLLARHIAEAFSWGQWGALEDVLLELTRRSGNALQLVILFPGPSRLQRHCNELMPRFREVGEVRFERSGLTS